MCLPQTSKWASLSRSCEVYTANNFRAPGDVPNPFGRPRISDRCNPAGMVCGWLDVRGHPAQNTHSMSDIPGCLPPGSHLDFPNWQPCSFEPEGSTFNVHTLLAANPRLIQYISKSRKARHVVVPGYQSYNLVSAIYLPQVTL